MFKLMHRINNTFVRSLENVHNTCIFFFFVWKKMMRNKVLPPEMFKGIIHAQHTQRDVLKCCLLNAELTNSHNVHISGIWTWCGSDCKVHQDR